MPHAGPFDPDSLPYLELEARVTALGGAPEHALRWYRNLHRAGLSDPGAAHELGTRLTTRLAAAARPARLELEANSLAGDGTRKLRFRLADGARIESVLIPDKARLTLCLSSQAGCGLGCAFCATAALRLVRNLTAGEIVGQVLAARRLAQGPITNLVFMGMGEPLHNWPAVRGAIRILTDPNAHMYSRHRITVSTVGVLPRLADVIRETGVGLALSLHATDDEARNALIPLNRRYPIAALLAELGRLAREEKARVMIQYLLLAGSNDSPAHARRLWELVRGFPCHVNLLTYNPVPGLAYRPPTPRAVRAFKAELLERGVRVYHRQSRGADIAAACGQLALT
jgi:23S rRNA (adenine2503-C2)-methyltransferase